MKIRAEALVPGTLHLRTHQAIRILRQQQPSPCTGGEAGHCYSLSVIQRASPLNAFHAS